MDATHFHLVLSHFPIIGTIIGLIILTYGLFNNNIEAQKIALGTFILMALLTIPVFLTGEGAEDRMEKVPGISEQLIENHEELAEKAIWLMGFLGILSIINLFSIIRKLSFAKTITWVTLLISLATCAVFAQVGNLGGQIRHVEISDANYVAPLDNDSSKINKDDD